MPFRLSLSANPFVNRFAEPEDLIRTIAEDIGLGYVQLVHEFINPAWPAATVGRLTAEMAKACASRRVSVTSLMTGPYGRLNHFGHPDADVRDYYVGWFKGMVDIAADLGCPAVGTQYAILTYRDYDDPRRRAARAPGRRRSIAGAALPTMRIAAAWIICSGSRCRSAANSATPLRTRWSLQDISRSQPTFAIP